MLYKYNYGTFWVLSGLDDATVIFPCVMMLHNSMVIWITEVTLSLINSVTSNITRDTAR